MREYYSPAARAGNFGIPQPLLLQEMVRQADIWRDSLPTPIQWTDDAASDQNLITQQSQQNLKQNFPPPGADSSSSSRCLRSSHSSSALNAYPISLPSEVIHPVLDARIRTRFYHVRYSIYRCYIYKVLHFPEHTSTGDIEKCVLCLKVCIYVLPPAGIYLPDIIIGMLPLANLHDSRKR